jgi:ribosomal protein L7/L12
MADEREIEERLAWLEASVRRIAGSVSPTVTLPPHPYADTSQLSDEVKALIDSGKTIQAIQLHRQETGAGLAEAKSAVESYSA